MDMARVTPHHRRRSFVLFAVALFSSVTFAQASPEQRYPDVADVKVKAAAGDTFDFDVTVSSPYDTPSRYADAFHVVTLAGQVLGERKLLHDHQSEQPFTRELYGVRIPAAFKEVVVQARDQKNGYGGKSARVRLPGR